MYTNPAEEHDRCPKCEWNEQIEGAKICIGKKGGNQSPRHASSIEDDEQRKRTRLGKVDDGSAKSYGLYSISLVTTLLVFWRSEEMGVPVLRRSKQ